uniref:hypothetical protein n=1 Tax=uncultured Lentibacter sp. TaxID=1659309 RepID=UPI002634A9C7
CVYKGDMPLHHSCFKVTPDLKVVMTDPPDLRNIYSERDARRAGFEAYVSVGRRDYIRDAGAGPS